ncbi:MAG: class I SAM-dependent methyltransferase [Oscillospiraceae bacterium]|jgi:SAM-dependent methyltransferase|nr:class I SAM-dependent methyltransferase [Oscillospiraceae bacterium]
MDSVNDNGSQNIYDNQVFFDGYRKLRENPDSSNVLEEKPALFSLSPDLTGLSVLDLGCGYGENCAEFKRRGAWKVVGVDISEKMLSIAKTENTGIEFINADMSDLSFITAKFDVVFSSLAIHYVKDFARFAKSVAALLNPGGYFIFSQEHPLTTAPLAGASWTRDVSGIALHYNLTDYARGGKRSTTWIVDGVVKYHRTFSELINALTDCGFMIEKLSEPVPTEETILRLPAYAQDLHKPNFLLIKAIKSQPMS